MPIFIKIAKKIKFVDIPTKRKNHKNPIPLVGGLCMYSIFSLCYIIFLGLNNLKHVSILIGASIVFLVGLIDDYYKSKKNEFSILIRASAQILSAIILFLSGIKFTGFLIPFTKKYILFPGYIQFLLTIFWVFGVTTVINFSDGLDGLAGGLTCISSTTFFLTAIIKNQNDSAIIAVLIFSISLAFLKYNFYPAKVFMGDSGACFLGYILAVISLHGAFKQATLISIFIPVLAIGIPIFDNISVIIKRFLNKKPIHKADNTQIHYRLLESGMNTKQTVKYLFLMTVCLNLTSIIILLLKV
jgi:UDP-N-acetylmuramyl pentapeptide phosphotransferase/UDP-N-acetylglucosamine-1-phosphate transferase